MTEVRSARNGVGLFATRDYQPGDVILEDEIPLLRLAPTCREQEIKLLQTYFPDQGTNDNLQLWEAIPVPSEISQPNIGKFKGMVQAGLMVLEQKELWSDSSSKREQLLQLYYPEEAAESTNSSSLHEQEILKTAKLAVDCLETNPNIDQSQIDSGLLRKIILIWSCNSFEGGRLYPHISRLNHSCRPNAVIKARGDQQSVKAATPIVVGDEICISYLDLFLYAERPIRQSLLQQTKHFDCMCARCQDELEHPDSDKASLVPCFKCHERMASRQLDEDTQYDDEQTVSYTCGWNILSDKDGEEPSCTTCNADKTGKNQKHGGKQGIDDKKRLANAMEQVRNKVVAFLQERSKFQTISKGGSKDDNDADDDEEERAVQADLLDQHLRLASSIMGSAHWTTNLLLLLQLDDTLQCIHREMLISDTTPNMDDLAQAIDMLQRCARFVDGLALGIHQGHLLSDSIIGTARALVSLGDVKSKTYAKEWVEPLEEYVKRFEPEGLHKVVQTIASAHQQHEEGKEPHSKKAKRK